jgi:hypothetical protein
MVWFDTKQKKQRRANPRGPKWKQRDGTLVLVASMTDDHLRNALRMLHRLTDAWAWLSSLDAPNGDMAQEAHAEWCGALAEKGPTDLLRAGPHADRAAPLLAEWAKRKYAKDTWDDGSRGRMAIAILRRLFPEPKPAPPIEPTPTTCDCIDCSLAGEPTH